jgi:hypothetical protein
VKRAFFLLLSLFLCVSQLSFARRGSYSGSRSSHRSYHSPTYRSHSNRAISSRHGRIHRSAAAKREFMKQTGHPHGWSGHVVDHVVPLACGGADAPSNMQWQTVEEAKAKDKWERKGCK